MSRKPRPTWRQVTQRVSLSISILVSLIFEYLGKNPFDPDNLFGKNPQNDLFLWLSTATWSVAMVLYFALVRVEVTRKDVSIGRESLSHWYQERNRTRATWLVNMLLLPSLFLGWIFWNLALLSHLELFVWLRVVAILVFIAMSAVQIGLMIKGSDKRARERETDPQTGR